MIKILAVIFVTLFVSLPTQAKYITSLGGPGVEITRVFVHESGAISLYITGSVLNLDECSSTFRVYIPENAPAKDTMLSTALMAFASARKVGFHGSGCSTTPFWGGTVDVPVVNNLWVF